MPVNHGDPRGQRSSGSRPPGGSCQHPMGLSSQSSVARLAARARQLLRSGMIAPGRGRGRRGQPASARRAFLVSRQCRGGRFPRGSCQHRRAHLSQSSATRVAAPPGGPVSTRRAHLSQSSATRLVALPGSACQRPAGHLSHWQSSVTKVAASPGGHVSTRRAHRDSSKLSATRSVARAR